MNSLLINIISLIIGSGSVTYLAHRYYEHNLQKSMFRFTKHYSDNIETIKELYRLLIRSEKALKFLMISDKNKDEQLDKNTRTQIEAFFIYFEENEIIFDECTTLLINQLKEKFDLSIDAKDLVDNLEITREKVWANAIKDKWEIKERVIGLEIPELKKSLKKEFQKKYEFTA